MGVAHLSAHHVWFANSKTKRRWEMKITGNIVIVPVQEVKVPAYWTSNTFRKWRMYMNLVRHAKLTVYQGTCHQSLYGVETSSVYNLTRIFAVVELILQDVG